MLTEYFQRIRQRITDDKHADNRENNQFACILQKN